MLFSCGQTFAFFTIPTVAAKTHLGAFEYSYHSVKSFSMIETLSQLKICEFVKISEIDFLGYHLWNF